MSDLTWVYCHPLLQVSEHSSLNKAGTLSKSNSQRVPHNAVTRMTWQTLSPDI